MIESNKIMTNPFDKVISQSVKNVLEEDLGQRTYKKIEKEIGDTLEISMLEATQDFKKLDLVLRNFFGNNVTKIEKRIFRKIIELDKKSTESGMILIKDNEISQTIFESYGDPIKKRILNILLDDAKSIPQTISDLGLPQASTYRRAKELIKDGLVTMVGYTNASDGRKVNEYETTFSRAKFDVQKKGLHVSVKLQNKFLRDSFVADTILNK